MNHERALIELRFSAAMLGAMSTLLALADFSTQFYVGAAVGLLAGFLQIDTAVSAHTTLKELRNDKSE